MNDPIASAQPETPVPVEFPVQPVPSTTHLRSPHHATAQAAPLARVTIRPQIRRNFGGLVAGALVGLVAIGAIVAVIESSSGGDRAGWGVVALIAGCAACSLALKGLLLPMITVENGEVRQSGGRPVPVRSITTVRCADNGSIDLTDPWLTMQTLDGANYRGRAAQDLADAIFTAKGGTGLTTEGVWPEGVLYQPRTTRHGSRSTAR